MNIVLHQSAIHVDYLCLKLGWTTQQVLANAHHDNLRKLSFYHRLDRYNHIHPLGVIPLGFDKDGTKSYFDEFKAVAKDLENFSNMVEGEGLKSNEPDELDEYLQSEAGFMDLLKSVKNGNLKGEKLAGG